MLAFNKPFTKMMAIPLGGGLTSTQQDIRKLNNIFNSAINFVPTLGDFNVFFSGNNKEDILKNLGKSILGILPKIGSVSSVADFATALFTEPQMESKNYTNSEKEFITMMGIEQVFALDFCDSLSEKGIPYDVNYSESHNSFINNITIHADWDNPMEQLKSIFDNVKNSKPDLYKDVQSEF